MTRRLTVLFSAFEGLLAVAIGVAIPLVPLTLLWALHFGFGPDWTIFWRGSVDIWLLGHGVDVTFRLDEATAEAIGMPGAAEPVPVTIALLGFALVTLLLAVRAGRRIAETGYRLLGGVAAVIVVAGAATALTSVSLHPDARPSLVQAALLPGLVFAVGLLLGMLREHAARRRDDTATAAKSPGPLARLDPAVRGIGAAVLRAGFGTVALVLAAASVVVTALLLIRYAEIIRLYESLHTEVLGGFVVTAAELAILPNLVVWAACWLVGPGFALGAHSTVSPLGTALGPVPALPVLGAVPTGDAPFAFAGLIVPVLAAAFVGIAVRRRLERDRRDAGWPVLTGIALGGGVVGGGMLALLAAASAGAAGPGRLAEVGPDPLIVGLVAALEFAIGLGTGLAVGLTAGRRLRPGR